MRRKKALQMSYNRRYSEVYKTMRYAALFAFIAIGTPAFGQNAPDKTLPGKTIEDQAKKRILKFDLLAPRAFTPPATPPLASGSSLLPGAVVIRNNFSVGNTGLIGDPLRLPARPSAVCSIPLLNSRPAGNYTTPIIRPQSSETSSRELKLNVPAPACDEKLFPNQ